MSQMYRSRKASERLSLPLIPEEQGLGSVYSMTAITLGEVNPPPESTSSWGQLLKYFKKTPPSNRRVYFDGQVTPPNHVPNLVKNQKYNIFTFVPKFLYNEFKLFFNLFFLLTALTQFVPALQTGYLISYFGPLSLVLLLTMTKELYDDYMRHKRDREANSTLYKLITREQEVIDTPSSALKVGDVIEVHSNQRIPADLVLLHTSEPSGSIFIRTDQLDGETDWKLRKAIRYTQNYVNTKGNLAGLAHETLIFASPPIENIYNFEGVFITEEDKRVARESLTLENTLWANTILAAGKIYAMVIYTGRDMRTVMNAREPRTKVAKADLEINLMSKVLFVALVGLSLLLVALQGFGKDWFIQFIRFLTLLSTIIPISLRVNMDFSKIAFSGRINSDKTIAGTIARNRSIPEDLGRIEYLFTDKTGTLTKNEMVFKKFALETGVIFSISKTDDIRRSLRKGLDREVPTSAASATSEPKEPLSATSIKGGLDDIDEMSPKQKKYRQKREKEYQQTRDFWRAITLCNNVTPIQEDGKTVYQASSPDEIALIGAAEPLGMKLISRDQNNIVIENSMGRREEYTILINFPFSSENKRMGIVLKNEETGKITFYLKGADMVMTQKVSQKQQASIYDTCEVLAQEGLRTLVVAQKTMTSEEFARWKAKYDQASHTMSSRNKRIQGAIESLEVDMHLLGITGVEDKLQDEVTTTLDDMKSAGIKIWMLTGDKVETAVAIAINAGLASYKQTMTIMKELTDPEDVQSQLRSFEMARYNNVLIIDGKTLEVALANCPDDFYRATTTDAEKTKPTVVVCCRCSPTQKAQIVEGVKKLTKKVTCAIGDGGNDVAMIQAADVGIGVEGKEGKQAALAADYSIPRFNYLNKLLLWHGRNSYKGSASLAHFVIHRGLIISFIQAIFSFVFYDVSISIYTGILNLGYTTIFTWLPVLTLIFDEDIDEERALRYPNLYKSLQKGRELSLKSFCIWFWWSLYQAAVIMLCTIYMFDNSYNNIITITFTTLIASEIFNVWTTLNKVHRIAIISACFSMTAYILVIVLLKKDINASAITLKFLYKVIFLTTVSWLPMHTVRLLKNRFAPTVQEKVMMLDDYKSFDGLNPTISFE